MKLRNVKLACVAGMICVIGSLFGCGDIKSVAGFSGPWPVLPEPTPLALTDSEFANITKWAKEDPGLVGKLKRKNDESNAVIVAYNKAARKHNHDALIAAGSAGGWTKEDIKRYAEDPEKSKE